VRHTGTTFASTDLVFGLDEDGAALAEEYGLGEHDEEEKRTSRRRATPRRRTTPGREAAGPASLAPREQPLQAPQRQPES